MSGQASAAPRAAAITSPPSRALTRHVPLPAPSVVHSLDLLDDLLTPEMRAHPAWASWTKLVQVYAMAVQPSFTKAQILELDERIVAHSAAFDQVSEYYGLKRPKHHNLCHLPINVWRHGPMRGYWCYGFEAFNKVLKAGANRSNFKAPVDAIGTCRLRSAVAEPLS